MSTDEFYTPTDIDALRMENELLAFEVRFLKARLAQPDRRVDELRTKLAEAERTEEHLKTQLARLQARSATLQAQNASLRAQLTEVKTSSLFGRLFRRPG